MSIISRLLKSKAILVSLVFGLVAGAISIVLFEYPSQYISLPVTYLLVSFFISFLFLLFVAFNFFSDKQGSERKGLHEILMNSIEEALVVFDLDGRISIENENFKKIFNPWNKKNIHDVLRNDTLNLILSSDKVIGEESKLYDCMESRACHFSITSTSFDRENKEILLTLRNIEKKYQEDALIKSQMASVEASSRLSSLEEMASGFAHEINNPLSVISANNLIMKKTLESMELGEEKRRKFEKLTDGIDQTIVRISKIILGLRNLAKEKYHHNLEKVDVQELVDEATVLTKVKLYSTGINFYTDKSCVSEEDQYYLHCNKAMMIQVIMSLVSNSIDAVRELDEKWIKIKIVAKEENVDIIVEDSGHGIEQTIAQKIFQPMYTSKEYGDGLGLGLSVAHAMTKRQGGTLVLDEESSHTRFVITIPRLIEENLKQAA